MSLTARLTGFLTAETNARPVAVARIGVALAILLQARNSADVLLHLAEPSVIRTPYFSWMVSPSAPLVSVLLAVWVLAALSLLVGFRTRLAGTLLTAALAGALLLDQQLYSNHLYLMVLVVGLLTIADSGAALSIDAMTGHQRPMVPAWPVFLLRAQVSLVYGFAALAKLNPDSVSGSVVAASLRRDGPLAVPDAWRSLEPMLILAVLAILAEAFVAAALWSRRWRPAAFVVALGLHTVITAWFDPTYELLVYSLLMLPLLILFLNVVPAGRTVVWDDSCGFCADWVRWFKRLDWLRALEFVPRSRLAEARLPVTEDEAARALQLVRPGSVRGGFAAVTGVLEIFPISFLWAPFLRLPPIAWVGERAYARVAARRSCDVALPIDHPSPSARNP